MNAPTQANPHTDDPGEVNPHGVNPRGVDSRRVNSRGLKPAVRCVRTQNALRRRVGTLWTLATARTPVYVILYLTSRCNFRCPMCFYLEEIKDPEKKEIALPEMEKMSRSLGRLVQLSLTGGEPFLRGDIVEIVEIFARNNGVQYVTIPTNGSLSDRIGKTVGRLVTAFPNTHFRIPVSLDGFPEDHDAIRGGKSFAKIEETLRVLDSIRQRVDNLTVDINTCYSSLNQGKLNGFADFVANRFDVDNHTVTYVRGNADEATKDASARDYGQLVDDLRRRRGSRESRPLSFLLRALVDYQRDIIRRMLDRDRMHVPCVAGKKLIVVNEKAEVLPCEILSATLGHLQDHDYDIRDLLSKPRTRDLVGWIRRTKCHCTFECALAISIVYHAPSYPRVVWRAVKEWLRQRPPRKAALPAPGLNDGSAGLAPD